jgi:hypothetical protein
MTMDQASMLNPKACKQDFLFSDVAEGGLPHLDGWLHCPQYVVQRSDRFVLPRR